MLFGRHAAARPPFVAQRSYRLKGGDRLPFVESAGGRRQNRLHYRCNSKGYESVALVALGEGPETFGLLQFSDLRKGMFPSAMLGELEEVADIIALSLRQRHTQELLAKNETRFRRIVETADEGILIFDAQHRITYVNVRLSEIMGYAPEQLQGCSFESFLFPEDLPAHQQRMIERKAGRSQRYETRFRRPDGAGGRLSIFIFPVRKAY
jgi:PAS domain S-box-containing protein